MMTMKKKIREILFRYFNGQKSTFDVNIKKLMQKSDSLTSKIVEHYFSGGSYKQAPILFFIAESTYYYRLSKFIKGIEKSL